MRAIVWFWINVIRCLLMTFLWLYLAWLSNASKNDLCTLNLRGMGICFNFLEYLHPEFLSLDSCNFVYLFPFATLFMSADHLYYNGLFLNLLDLGKVRLTHSLFRQLISSFLRCYFSNWKSKKFLYWQGELRTHVWS